MGTKTKMNPHADILALLDTNDPLKIFGSGPDAHAAFVQLSKKYHPDKAPKEDRDMFGKIYARITEIYNRISGKKAVEVKIIGGWEIKAAVAKGDITDVYRGYKDGAYGLLKISHSEANNEFLNREFQALKVFRKGKNKEFLKYTPALLEHFTIGDRTVNAFQEVEGIPLHQLSALYDTSDFRHWVWIFNRLLTALWFSHSNGIVHGAVIPEHLMYIPKDHGLVLIDWTAACKENGSEYIPYISKDRKFLYAPEVSRKLFTPATDIYMAAKCMAEFMPADVPGPFRNILEYCLARSPSSRPQEAGWVQKLWKKVAEQVYGPPQFVEMKKKRSS